MGLQSEDVVSGFILSFSTLHQMWEVITKKGGIEVSYRWFVSKEIAEAFRLKLFSVSN